MRSTNGQILPFCMLLLCLLMWFFFSNAEIGYQLFRKVEEQKKLDGYALDLGTQYVRAYNSMAALNEGLSIINQRAYLVAGVYSAVSACAAAMVKPCIRSFQKMSRMLPDFYKKLHKLGQSLAKSQDQISQWMIRTQCRTKIESHLFFDRFQIYPDIPCIGNQNHSLPFSRPPLGTSMFDIPAPLQFKPEFFAEKNKVILITTTSIESPFKNHHGDSLDDLPQHLYSMSEIQIHGSNFQEMNFDVSLNAISLENQLSQKLQHDLYSWPNIVEISNEIHH